MSASVSDHHPEETGLERDRDQVEGPSYGGTVCAAVDLACLYHAP